MASQEMITQMLRQLLKEADEAGRGVLFFDLKSSDVKELPDQKAYLVTFDARWNSRKSTSKEFETTRIRWILPKENVFKDIQGQEWGLPWSISSAVRQEPWNAEDVPNIEEAEKFPSWYGTARKFFLHVAKKACKSGEYPFQKWDLLRLEGRLNALWAGPFGEIGKMLRADRLDKKANPLKKLEAARRVELEIKPSSQGDGRIRRPHRSHEGVLCPFHTPESKRIGLQLYRSAARDSQGNPLSKDPGELGSLLSLAVGMIPYLQHSDGPRLLMGGKNMKQAETFIQGSEAALVPGELETHQRAFREIVGKEHVKDDRLYPFLGVNALVAVMPYQGYTYEDGLVISRSFAEKLSIPQREETQRTFLSLFINGKKEKETKTSPVMLREFWQKEMQEYLGNSYVFGDPLPLPDCGEFCGKEKGLPSPVYEEREPGVLSEVTLRFLQKRTQGKSKKYNHEERTPLDMEITWHFTISRPMRVGDKLTGRHGNKGVVTRILEDPLMVRLGDGEFPVDLCISPCSVLGRKNFGQIAEMVHSLALKLEKEGIFTPSVPVEDKLLLNGKEERRSWRDLIPELEEAKILEHGTAPIKIPGDDRECRAFVGYQYFCRLQHHARAKLQARGIRGPMNVMTGQPSSGIPRGGQRLGEMENWAFLSHGVHQDYDGEGALGLLNGLREIPLGPKAGRELLEDILYALGYENDSGVFSGVKEWKPLRREEASRVVPWKDWADIFKDSREEIPSRGLLPLGNTPEEEKKVFQALGACVRRAAAREEVDPKSAQELREFLGEPSCEEDDLLHPLREALQEIPEKMEKNEKFYFSLKGFFLLRPGALPVAPRLFTLRDDSTRPLKRRDYSDLLRIASLLSELSSLNEKPEKQDQQCKVILKKLRIYRQNLEKLVEGKMGYLRRHCMGRRCSFSGRGVIVSDPSLALDEVRLPVAMFLEMMQGHSITAKRGLEKRIESLLHRAWREENLSEVTREAASLFEHAPLWAVLIRQPSLHRHSVQSFKITLWEDAVIALPPFITPGFNADFDGDTMAVYIPREEDQRGAAFMSLCKSPGKTGDGSLQIASDKDLALGWCALSPQRRRIWLDLVGLGDTPEPFEKGWVTLEAYLNSLCALRGEEAFKDMARLQAELCETSTGAATISPQELQACYHHLEEYRKKGLELLEKAEGVTEEKLQEELEKIQKESEEHITAWLQEHPESSLAGLVLGKARGKAEDLRQTLVSLGYQNKFVEDEGTEENPVPYRDAWIQGSFWGGLSPKELFLYSYASRESMASKKLAVAPAGHLTWKLAEGLYDVVVTEGDCGTSLGLGVRKDPTRKVLCLTTFGKISLQEEPLVFPGTWESALENFAWGRVPLGMNRPLSRRDLKDIRQYWEEGSSPCMARDVKDHLESRGGELCLRSPLTCNYPSQEKLCPLCCGVDVAKMPLDSEEHPKTLELLPPNAPVGLTAAEAIGERGTQLAMKRFHQVGTGGGGKNKVDRLQKLDQLLVRKDRKSPAPLERFKEILEILGEGKAPEDSTGSKVSKSSKISSATEERKRYKELPQQMIHFEVALVAQEGLKALALQQGLPLRVARDVGTLWKPFHREEAEEEKNAEKLEPRGFKEKVFHLGDSKNGYAKRKKEEMPL